MDTNKNNKSADEDVTDVTVSEETLSAGTLKPAARSVSDPKALDASKVSMMKSILHVTAGMGKEDMTQWFDKAMALIGHEADKVGDNSGKNQASIDMKTGKGPKTKDAMPKIASITPGQSMKEDVENLFSGEELTEEFKEKATAIFEAAVVSHLLVAREELEEQYNQKLNEEIARIEEETTDNLDKYLDYVVEEWMKENEVAVETALRTELTQAFMEDLKKVFENHYINMPDERIDVVEKLTDTVSELESKLDALISENAELKNLVVENQVSSVVEELASDLALSQQEKFKSLAEEIDFDGDLETFAKKLQIVKENYFTNKKTSESNIETETFESETNDDTTRSIDPGVNRYVAAISRTVK